MNAVWFWMLAACADAPATKASCDAMPAGEARDKCYLEVLEAVFQEDEAAGVKMIEQGLTDPVVRDLAWYRAMKVRMTPSYCRRVQDEALRKGCIAWVSAPWLQRTERTPGSG